MRSQWKVRGTRNSIQIRERIVSASTHQAAVQAASEGTGFIRVQDCVLCTDIEADRIQAIQAMSREFLKEYHEELSE
jgi:hypothetical protein